MKERLNLTIDTELLAAIKAYAASKNTSVSELVESYFRCVTKPLNRKNIIELVDALEAPASNPASGKDEDRHTAPCNPPGGHEASIPGSDRSDAHLAEVMDELMAWAKQPGPMTSFKKSKHGI